MSLKLFALVVLAALAFAKAQSPVDPAAAPPTLEDLVAQQAAKVQHVVSPRLNPPSILPQRRQPLKIWWLNRPPRCSTWSSCWWRNPSRLRSRRKWSRRRQPNRWRPVWRRPKRAATLEPTTPVRDGSSSRPAMR
uniref:(northern house mosquito) hypothetical protein n=1 Tax=Culex pipiens TaxID=7175 RepID=A0A8D8NT59_CULPI